MGNAQADTPRAVARIIDAVIAREGGYVDHPADRGGPTHYGITQAVAQAAGHSGPVRDLGRAQAVAIYQKLYSEGPGFARLAQIAPDLACELFDTGVNMGPGTAIGFLQRALNALNRNGTDYPDIAVDRKLGPTTHDAVRRLLAVRAEAGEQVLRKAVDALQGAHYVTLTEKRPANEAFAFGWIAHRVG